VTDIAVWFIFSSSGLCFVILIHFVVAPDKSPQAS